MDALASFGTHRTVPDGDRRRQYAIFPNPPLNNLCVSDYLHQSQLSAGNQYPRCAVRQSRLEAGVDHFLVLILLVALIVIGAKKLSRPDQTRRAPDRPAKNHDGLDYAARQLTVVMRSDYSRKRLMNSHEFRVFSILEKELQRQNDRRRLFSQVSLGEILSAEGEAYDAINSKRVDLLIVDRYGMPEVVIEHQGQGHSQGNAAARDAIKKEALRRAGIKLVETFEDDDEADILRKVLNVRAPAAATAAEASVPAAP